MLCVAGEEACALILYQLLAVLVQEESQESQKTAKGQLQSVKYHKGRVMQSTNMNFILIETITPLMISPNDEWKDKIRTSFVILMHWIFYTLRKGTIPSSILIYFPVISLEITQNFVVTFCSDVMTHLKS